MDKIPLYINKSSGTVRKLGEDKVLGLIDDGLKNVASDIHLYEGGELHDLLKDIADIKPPAILVGGGDGTGACAAEALAGCGVPFGLLPLGTMNLLARDLGAAASFEETLERFTGFEADRIDAGDVNGKMFLCAAAIGFMPEGAVAREELRDNISAGTVANFLGMLTRGLTGEEKHRLHIKLEEGGAEFSFDTTMLAVSNNLYTPDAGLDAHSFYRDTLKDGRLGVYSASPRGMIDGLGMALSMWQGSWQEHESISAFETKGMIVKTGYEKTLVTLDGEAVEMEGDLRFAVRPRHVPVLRLKLSA